MAYSIKHLLQLLISEGAEVTKVDKHTSVRYLRLVGCAKCLQQNKHRKYSQPRKIIISGRLDYFGLSFYNCYKYFLLRSNSLLMPSPVRSNALPLSPSLSVSPLSCSLPTIFLRVFKPIVSTNQDHSINTFWKELFSFQRFQIHKTSLLH